MKVRYQFANEAVEIEVADEWCEVLIDLDRQEYNNDHKETRRHVSMDMMIDEQGVEFADPHCGREDKDTLDDLLLVLTPAQRKLLSRIYLDGESMSTIAREEGVSKPSIHERVARAKKKISQNRR